LQRSEQKGRYGLLVLYSEKVLQLGQLTCFGLVEFVLDMIYIRYFKADIN